MTARWPLAACLLLAALLTGAAFALVPVRSDLTDLLPRGTDAASRVMLRQLRSGAATSLVLAAIDGGSETALASLSTGLAQTLRRDPRVSFVENGQDMLGGPALQALFAHRYLLSPATTAASFDVAPLHADFGRLLDGLQSSAFPLVEQFGLPDPTGAFPALLAAWAEYSHVRTTDGVWLAEGAGAPRALLLIRLRSSSAAANTQSAAIAAISADFAALPRPCACRLLLAGPAIFAAEAERGVRADVLVVTVLSALLVAALLIWRLRSPWVLAAVAVPPLLGIAAGVAAVGLVYGAMQTITVGFGMTMLGVTVDYPVLLVGHRKAGEAAADTLARIGPTFLLAVLTAAIGLSAMVFAAVPGVAQLGLFAVTGLAVAAAATVLLLPLLIVRAGLAPVAFGDPVLLHRVEAWRRHRRWGALAVAASALFLLLHGVPVWRHDLAGLVPIPAAALRLDATLRHDLGAPEPGQFALLGAPSAEAVLVREEALLPALRAAVHDGTMDGFEMAARLLPSAARQRSRQAVLPPAAELHRRIAAAAAGLPFTATAFQPFESDVAAARTMPPVRPATLAAAGLDDPALAAQLDALLLHEGAAWYGVVAPLALHAPARFAALFAGQPDATFVDIGQQTARIVAAYARSELRLLCVGAALSVAALAIVLRDAWRVLRVAGSVTAAVLVTLALLTAGGVRLSLVHLAVLPFVAGVGLDYALFFARPQVDAEERARTLRTLLTCVAMALLTFGLLATCRTPLLREIGATVAIGVAAAMCSAFLFAGPKDAG